MKSVIVGTAGHIDHGKTALVKALTGIDADRLEEEKRRGITIDIGFAHLELPAPDGETLRLGFVDVPGHERFVRNMLAGVGGIDLVLLVIAADESIKPQTREHFDICRLLNIHSGLTVLTKCDLVDRETLDVSRLEAQEFVRGSFLQDAPVIAVSSKTGEGMEELKRALAAVATNVPAKYSDAITRLPVDRVFTMKGFGTVVTGTLLSGIVRKEDELEVFPGGRRVRVRGVQVHGAAAEQAVAGQRTALNLAGASTDDLARGMTLTQPGLFRATRRVDVSLNLLPTAKPLRDHARVHLHVHTAQTIADVVLLGKALNPEGEEDAKSAEDGETTSAVAAKRVRELAPGSTAFAQLRLADPLLLLPGDRFILRQFSPVVTIGGGVVVDNSPIAVHKGRADELPFYLSRLQTLADGTPGQQLLKRVSRRSSEGLSLGDAVAETGWSKPRLLEVISQELVAAAEVKLPPQLDQTWPATREGFFFGMTAKIVRLGEVLISNAAFLGAQIVMLKVLLEFHRANPLVAGISKEELREKLDLGPEVFNGVLDALLREKKLEVSGEQVRAAGRGVVMKDEEAESKRQIEQAFAAAGLKVPALKEVLAGLKVDRGRAQKIVTLLLRDKVLVKISEELVFHRNALDELRRMIREYKSTSAKIDVGKFKELTGVSRKYAIPLLEYLDRERVTWRAGDERVIL